MGVENLSELPERVYGLFDPDVDHVANEEYLEIFAQECKELLRKRLAKQEPDGRPIRFSSLGKPDRQIWYASQGQDKERMTGKTLLKFLYGDIIEQMVLYLVREADYEVTDCQRQVEIDGITGSIDAIVAGVVVDVKSASPFGYKKLKTLKLLEPGEDAFGYVQQLSGYANVLTPGKEAAWIAFDKVSGDLSVPVLSSGIVSDYPPAERIAHLKEVIKSDEPPPRCYPDQPEGKSGNRSLTAGCSYCAFKTKCWPGLRTFLYSNGPKFLTVVKDLPRVPELSNAPDEAEPEAI